LFARDLRGHFLELFCMKFFRFQPTLFAALIGASLGSGVHAAETATPATTKQPYSPYAQAITPNKTPSADGEGFPTRPLFGDTHVHTSFSMDAGAFGARLTPADAYRFARGEQITSSTGQPVKLSRPLDFLVVSDHSDGFGFFPLLMSQDPTLMATPQGRKWYDLIRGGKGGEAAIDIITSFGQNKMPDGYPAPGTPAYASAWRSVIKAAEDANDPGRFTAIIGYEWTSNEQGNNLHRNVLFREGGTQAIKVEPFTTLPPQGSGNPADLWKWLEMAEKKTGSQILAIAHNGNLSNGRMFPTTTAYGGKKIDKDYVETRAKWERIYEATQIKGDGESYMTLSPTDEFANFEKLDKSNLDGSQAKTADMYQYEYAREALKNGLKLEQEFGTNPYKVGMIGSTDSHTGLATADESNFFGKASNMEPSPKRLSKDFFRNFKTGIGIKDWQLSASGYAAVWAQENTRASIFDAMQRRETYATTGPRMLVRFFGGWDFTPADANERTPGRTGYAKGVPMGGDLTAAPAGKAPSFLVAAVKDPIGANLDRVQIIKGWLDAKGETHEKVYDVVWSDTEKRQPGKDRKLPAVGSTVDLANANWTNTIGASDLITVWSDPEFDAKQSAFYYARVLEIPTPRWTAFDAKYYNEKAGEAVPMVLQERAYTSPIWYTP
jgi:hypothetical protein